MMLFVDGKRFDCADAAARFAEAICANDSVVSDPDLAKSAVLVSLLEELIGQGSLAFEDHPES